MTNPAKNWRTDWMTFIESVAEDFGNGLSDNEVSTKYANQKVIWIGIISEFNFNGYSHSAYFDMPAVNVRMKDGRHGKVNHLCLFLPSDDLQSWPSLASGTTIEFEAELSEGKGPFPGLSWADLGEQRGYISIGTKETGKLVRVIED